MVIYKCIKKLIFGPPFLLVFYLFPFCKLLQSFSFMKWWKFNKHKNNSLSSENPGIKIVDFDFIVISSWLLTPYIITLNVKIIGLLNLMQKY